jgi:hypothetical protein
LEKIVQKRLNVFKKKCGMNRGKMSAGYSGKKFLEIFETFVRKKFLEFLGLFRGKKFLVEGGRP